MIRSLFRASVIAVFAVISAPVSAQNSALVITNVRYDELPNVTNAGRLRYISSALRSAVFGVSTGTNKDGSEMHNMGIFFAQDASTAERAVVILQGHFVHTPRDTWLIGSDAPARANALTIGSEGISVGILLDVLAERPGRVILMLSPSTNPPEDLPGLEAGIGDLDIPQGVTVVVGPSNDIQNMVSNTLLRDGATTADLIVEADPTTVVSGFVSDAVEFTPAETSAPPMPDTDLLFWQIVQSIHSVEAYETYLDQFPFGNHTGQAQEAIDFLQAEPLNEAEEAEAALDLSLDQRREIQRALSILGYDTRGIDGIFGPGTRGAISQWQSENGLPVTSYLDNNQLRILGDQARRRAAELEEEARLRQLEEERQDRAYWQVTGASGSEHGLRTYLERYPDGLFADVATARLQEIENERLGQAQLQERNMWNQARDEDSIQSYRTYLRFYPNGLFSGAANERIAELEEDAENAAQREIAERRESQVVGNPIARVLVERQLNALGYEPGNLDGAFDEETRRAIRRFQRDHGITVTGYVDEATMVRLLVQ